MRNLANPHQAPELSQVEAIERDDVPFIFPFSITKAALAAAGTIDPASVQLLNARFGVVALGVGIQGTNSVVRSISVRESGMREPLLGSATDRIDLQTATGESEPTIALAQISSPWIFSQGSTITIEYENTQAIGGVPETDHFSLIGMLLRRRARRPKVIPPDARPFFQTLNFQSVPANSVSRASFPLNSGEFNLVMTAWGLNHDFSATPDNFLIYLRDESTGQAFMPATRVHVKTLFGFSLQNKRIFPLPVWWFMAGRRSLYVEAQNLTGGALPIRITIIGFRTRAASWEEMSA